MREKFFEKYETNIWNGRDFTQTNGEYISKAVNKFDHQGNIIENIYFTKKVEILFLVWYNITRE